jgi:hypothetical protein
LGTASATQKRAGVQRQAGHQSEGKKTLYWYTRLGKIETEEEIFTQGRRGPEIRPFSESAEVECRRCSEALQRAITDLGADDPFAGASKLKEHYGIAVPASTIRAITEKHGAAMLARQKPGTQVPAGAGVPRLIAEMDGSMVPVVETAASVAEAASIDHRKTRKLSGWKPACLWRMNRAR